MPTRGSTATRTRPPIWDVSTARPAGPVPAAGRSVAVAAVIAALVLLTVGIAIGHRTASAPPDAAPPAVRGPSTGTPPAAGSHHRTSAGAVATATADLVALSSRAYITDPAGRARTIHDIVIPDDRGRLAAAASVATGSAPAGSPLGAAFGPTRATAWRLVPLGWRLTGYNPDRATVEVWAVQVSAGVGAVAVPATATWTTTTLPLQWAGGRWRLDLAAATTTAGPTPGAGPGAQSPDLDVIAADSDFTEYRHDLR